MPASSVLLPVAMGIDCASPLNSSVLTCLRNVGVTFVCRYYAKSSWKRLTPEEAKLISEHGVGIVTVYQDANNHPELFTTSLGRTHGVNALQQARLVGQPQGTAIYFAVDFNARLDHAPAVLDYLRTAGNVVREGGYRVGVYGHRTVCNWALSEGVADYAWQTYAWSNGQVYPHAHLYQFMNEVRLCNHQVDLDAAFTYPGWWRLGGAVEVQPIRSLPTIRRGSRGYEVLLAQFLLAIAGYDPGAKDGVFGPKTEAAVRAFQQARGLRVDGVIGPATWGALTQPIPPKNDQHDRIAELERRIAKLEARVKELELNR